MLVRSRLRSLAGRLVRFIRAPVPLVSFRGLRFAVTSSADNVHGRWHVRGMRAASVGTQSGMYYFSCFLPQGDYLRVSLSCGVKDV